MSEAGAGLTDILFFAFFALYEIDGVLGIAGYITSHTEGSVGD